MLPLLKEAATEKDISSNIAAFQEAYDQLMPLLASDIPSTEFSFQLLTNRPWVTLIDKGYLMANGVVSTRIIPSGKARAFESAFQMLVRTRNPPKDIRKWWKTNGKKLELLFEAVKWPQKELGGDDLFVLGPFKVHNVKGFRDGWLDFMKKGVEFVAKLGARNPVPGFSRALYGDVFLVGQLTQAHVAAWYNPSEDSLYLRQVSRTGHDEAHAMLHELGHRYYQKFAKKPAKKLWGKWHASIRRSSDKKFPSHYASTNAEEHFCEALAMKAMGDLSREHLENFDHIWS